MADEEQGAPTAETVETVLETGGEDVGADARREGADAEPEGGDAQPDPADAQSEGGDPTAEIQLAEPSAEDPEEPEDDDGGIAAAAAALEADVERAFAFDTMTGPARATAKRFHSLARHVVEVLPEGNARAVALAKLRKARGAVLRPMLAV